MPNHHAGKTKDRLIEELVALERIVHSDSRSAILQDLLENIEIGVSVADEKLRLVAWNSRFLELLDFPREFGVLHRPYADFIRYNAERGEYGPGDIDQQVSERVARAKLNIPHEFIRTRADGTEILVSGRPSTLGGFVTTYTDITAEVRAKETLSRSEEKFRELAELSNDWFWEMDSDLRFTYFSPRNKEITGFNPDIYLGKSRREIRVGEEDDDHWRRHLADLDAHREFRHFEYNLKIADDQILTISINGRPIFDAAGNFLGYIGTGRDITDRKVMEADLRKAKDELEQRVKERTLELSQEVAERKRIEKSLQENQNLLRVFLDSTIDYAALVDKDGCFLIVNKAMAALYGKSLDELIGRPMLRLPLSETGKRRQKWFNDVLISGQAIRATDEHEGRWYDNSYFPVFDEAGNATDVAIFARDISELKETEKNLRQLSRAVEQAPNAVFITDTEGTIEFVNSMFTKITGYTTEEAIGSNSSILKSGYTSQETYAELWGAIKAGKEWRGEIKDRHKDGSYFWASETIGPVRNENGVITHFVATHEDITRRKETEVAMREAMEQADIANRAKSDMLANMSHELRTPLNAIIGFAGSIMAETFGPIGNENYLEYIGDIGSSGEHLLELINDILDVSAIEVGKLDLHEETMVVDDLVESSIRLISDRAKQKQIHLKTNVQKSLPLFYADARRIKQILLNLLSNAVKFTPDKGSVTLSVSLEDDGGHVFIVTDTGVGMNHVELAKAMTQFGQVDSGLSRKEQGSGLGLPLTKGLIDLHGGTIDIISEKGDGTTVTVKFTRERVVQDVY